MATFVDGQPTIHLSKIRTRIFIDPGSLFFGAAVGRSPGDIPGWALRGGRPPGCSGRAYFSGHRCRNGQAATSFAPTILTYAKKGGAGFPALFPPMTYVMG